MGWQVHPLRGEQPVTIGRGSPNGTHLSGERIIGARVLRPDDEIQVG
ncbi:MAG: hypothetical protein ACREOA_06960 [Candidatus Dormibacteria bacterium]